jgi:hypothetical protein
MSVAVDAARIAVGDEDRCNTKRGFNRTFHVPDAQLHDEDVVAAVDVALP